MRPCHATLAPGCQVGVTHAVGAGGACQTRRCEAFRRAPPGRRACPIVPPLMLATDFTGPMMAEPPPYSRFLWSMHRPRHIPAT